MYFDNLLFFFSKFLNEIAYIYYVSVNQKSGGPTPKELLRLLDQCDLCNSHCSTPCISPCPSLLGHASRIKASNVAFLNQQQQQQENTN